MHSRNIFQRSRSGSYCGYSLLELTLVVLILGIMALAVVPNFSSPDTEKLELAAEIQAEAMRYARAEAMRLGAPMGFRQQNGEKRIRVYNLDTGTVPWTPVYDIHHPISKKIWDISLDGHSFAAADSVSTNKVFRGSCNTPNNVYFDAYGIARCADPETVPVESYEVTLTLSGASRLVKLDGLSGKVTIQ